MKKKVVFISLPMKNLSDEQIRQHIETAKTIYLKFRNLDISDVTFIDGTGIKDPPKRMDEERQGLWYLGYSLAKLAKADEAYFYEGWVDARGCSFEHRACLSYGIPVEYMDDDLDAMI